MMGNEKSKAKYVYEFRYIYYHLWHLNHLVEADILKIMGCVKTKIHW